MSELSSNLKLIGVAALVMLAVVALVAVDRIWLDPGGRGFSGHANDSCREHDGVRWMDAHQGYVVCMDGWVVE